MPDTPPPRQAVVIRFPPGGPDQVTKMRQEAKYHHRHHQKLVVELWYRLSVWVDIAQSGESRLDVMRRLVLAAGLDSIRIGDERNSVIWWTTAGQIYDAGFVLEKDGEAGEPPEHYSVDLGDNPEREVVEAFAAVFEGPQPIGGAT